METISPSPSLQADDPPGLPTERTELGLDVGVSLPAPSAWSGGVHSGERLTPDQRAVIRQLWVEGHSKKKIAELTKHSRNTIAEVVAPTAEVEEFLRKSRAARMLLHEEELLRVRDEVIERKYLDGKLSVGDLNSALMIGGIAIKDAGGAAPQRIRVEADPSLLMAAQIFSGQFKPVTAGKVVVDAEVERGNNAFDVATEPAPDGSRKHQ